MTLEVLLVLLLILCNGFFALSEMSVVASRKPKLRQMGQESKRARTALELAEHPERFLSTVQVGITSIGILTGVFGGESIGNRIAAMITAPTDVYVTVSTLSGSGTRVRWTPPVAS